MNGIYTDKENLKVVFSYLIFNVAGSVAANVRKNQIF